MRLENLMQRTTTLYGKDKSVEITRNVLLKALKLTMVATHRADKEITLSFSADHLNIYGDLDKEKNTFKMVRFAREKNKAVLDHMKAELKAYADELNSKLEPITVLKECEDFTLYSNLVLALKVKDYTVEYDLKDVRRFNQVMHIMDKTAGELRGLLGF